MYVCIGTFLEYCKIVGRDSFLMSLCFDKVMQVMQAVLNASSLKSLNEHFLKEKWILKDLTGQRTDKGGKQIL